MKTKQFLASAAKAAFALAAVVMMSAVFTACSKDNDDDNPPAPKTQIVTLDGMEKTIVKAECQDCGQGNYVLYLYTDSNGSVFKTGTLTMSSSSGENINIQLKNGRVKGEDGKEYTLTVSYSGPMTKKK